jgi:hypothetical protein
VGKLLSLLLTTLSNRLFLLRIKVRTICFIKFLDIAGGTGSRNQSRFAQVATGLTGKPVTTN